MQANGILIHRIDQVITLTTSVKAGETVFYSVEGRIYRQQAEEDIPQYHKMAIQDIWKGQKVYKYGEEIGEATEDIRAGAWVHMHNLESSCLVSKERGRGEEVL